MTDKILEVRGLVKTYGGEKKRGFKGLTPKLDVLKGIDIDIYRGDVVCLIGPSGCGKSTFLRCLNRLEVPTGGTIKFEGEVVDEAHIDRLRQKMGMVFQHFNLFPHMTVRENLCMAPVLLKLKDRAAAEKRADELLERVGLSDKANVYPASLSGGQQQRIA
ncbi:MAG: ATP-binding cassette domain-containing protein, partial [Candidatus Faecalibacterium intestinavium]|nr:ATP-binding cassette domain-containing protein [Candidatus Faecalibacterium intestinavium]